eukprot:1294705-Amphidinium_carterae.1
MVKTVTRKRPPVLDVERYVQEVSRRKLATTTATVLVVYVDDLVCAGPGAKDLLCRLGRLVKLDPPEPLDKFLGVTHHDVTLSDSVTWVFEMRGFFDDAVKSFQSDYPSWTLKNVDCPNPSPLGPKEMDALLSEPGNMAPNAAKHLMKLMYGARMCYPQILVSISRLACNITRWTRDDDRRLHHLISFMHSHGRSQVLVGETLRTVRSMPTCKLQCYSDADLAGHSSVSSKSTTGFIILLETSSDNKRVTFPLTWGSHKQTATASSTPEAETVAMSTCLRGVALPLQHLLSATLGHGIDITMFQDNTATQQIVNKGYSGQLRSLQRTQRVAIGVLTELFQSECDTGRIMHERVQSSEQLADILTKPLLGVEFVAMNYKIGIRECDSVLNTGRARGQQRMAMPSASSDMTDGNRDAGDQDGGVSLIPPGPEMEIECEDIAPIVVDEIDDTTARRLRAEALSFEHAATHRPKNPFCPICVAGKSVASKALVRAIPMMQQLKIEDPFVALQIDHSFPFGRGDIALMVRDVVTSWGFALPVASKSAEHIASALRK